MLVLTGDTAARLARVHRAGAATAGLGTGLAAALGVSGALSAGLLVAAGTLVAAAVRGGRAASTAGVVVGTAMLLTGLTTVMVWGRVPDLFTAGTGYIVVLLVAGASALFVGAYGRYTGGLSPDSPYSRVPRNAVPAHPPVRPVAADAVALCELAAAERQVAARSASLEVTAAVAAVRPFRRAEDRVSAWRARTAADFDPGLAVRT